MLIIFLLLSVYFGLLYLGVKQGKPCKSLVFQSLHQVREMGGLLLILLLLGAMTASWRASGTLALLVTWGVRVVSPNLFLMITFFGTAAVGYVIGTSFGVAGIMGAVFMTIGTAGGVDPALTAGAILSGVYFGDRTSPVSSSFLTIQSITGISGKTMLYCLIQDAGLPFFACMGIYGVLSVLHPLQNMDNGSVMGFSGLFHLNPWLLLPAAVILLVPVLHVKAWMLILGSAGTAGLLAVGIQGVSVKTILETCMFGYRCPDREAGLLLDGGGMWGMVEICLIVCISAMLSVVLKASGVEKMLLPVIKKVRDHFGLSAVATMLIFFANGIFCNQTVPLYLADTCLGDLYDERQRMTVDFSDANILSGLIPWNIACSVPLALIGADIGCLPLAFFLYLAPLSNMIKSKIVQKRTKILQF